MFLDLTHLSGLKIWSRIPGFVIQDREFLGKLWGWCIHYDIGRVSDTRHWLNSVRLRFRGISRDFMGFRGISWDFAGFHGISRDFMRFWRISRDWKSWIPGWKHYLWGWCIHYDIGRAPHSRHWLISIPGFGIEKFKKFIPDPGNSRDWNAIFEGDVSIMILAGCLTPDID